MIGHIAVVEGNPPSVAFVEELQERTGYGAEAFRSLARHSLLDIHHRDELFDAIDALPLTRADEVLLGTSALHTVHGLIGVFEEVLDRAPARAAV